MSCSAFRVILTSLAIVAFNCPVLHALECFDSSVAQPSRTVHCSPGQSCYDEYYAYNTPEGHVYQHFDRFCVFHAHCTQRGIDNDCMSLDELDEVVQRTFLDKIRRFDKINRTQILHSRFCCCEQDGCNSFSAEDSLAKFNITSSFSPQSHHSSSLITSIISLSISSLHAFLQ